MHHGDVELAGDALQGVDRSLHRRHGLVDRTDLAEPTAPVERTAPTGPAGPTTPTGPAGPIAPTGRIRHQCEHMFDTTRIARDRKPAPGTYLGPMGRDAVVVSYRLGGHDGVSVEARKWAGALRELGFTVRRVAGEIEDGGEPGDLVVPGLAMAATEPPDPGTLAGALDGADLVVVENVCSLPLNADAARTVAKVVAEHPARVVFHHHDLPWQRRSLAGLEHEFPPRTPGALHVTVNLRSRRELEARGYTAPVTLPNFFDLDPVPGDRDGTRAHLGFARDELVVLQPARAIERKNVPGGVRFAARLAELLPGTEVRYWLSGPAEDGYQPTLDRVVARAAVPVTIGRAPSVADAYAACDVVVFPSTWEGFGNPTIESIAHGRPCAAARYPVLAEILATGVRLFSTDHPETLVRFLAEPPERRARYFEVNRARARLSYDLAMLPAALDAAFAAHGWLSW
ncbi:MAG: hypothetical protein KatS3mg009_1260 [Acidimicrobiia bacterium]|nr:MAG: hypothetical protein KatS3mg009_1260 [Acidimicrobiia bacterium]